MGMVLLDVMFVSGSTTNGLPSGLEGDEHFGEESGDGLLRNSQTYHWSCLRAKSKGTKDQRVRFLSKKGLNAHILKSELLRRGNLTDEQVAAILLLEPGTLVHSPAMREVFCQAFICAGINTNVLLLGETGVGKE